MIQGFASRVRGSLLLPCNPLKVLKDFCSSLKVLVTTASVLTQEYWFWMHGGWSLGMEIY